MPKIMAIFLICLLISSSVNAQAVNNDWCLPDKTTQIKITPQSSEIKYDFTKAKSELASLDIDTLSPYAENIRTEIGGLMKGGIKIRHGYKYGVRTNTSSGQICMWFDNIDVEIIINPEILIAKEYLQGTCKHEAVMTHEMKHVMKDREVSNIYAEKLRDALYAHVNKKSYIGPVNEDKMVELDIYMRSSIKRIVEDVKAKMIDYRTKEQRIIDNIHEYDAISEACTK